MSRLFLVFAVLLALPGCAALEAVVGTYAGEEGLALLEKASDGAEKVEDATLGNAAKALPKYCKVPGKTRALFRDRFNSRPETEGATLAVHCPGDPPVTIGGP